MTRVGIAPNPDVTRDYDQFLDLPEEFARSRIYGGIHFQFDSDDLLARETTGRS